MKPPSVTMFELATQKNLIRFETNRNYLQAISTLTKMCASDNVVNRGVLLALRNQKGYGDLRDRTATVDWDNLGIMLRNSWTAEVAVLAALRADNPIQASMLVPWSFVQMYYGLYHIFDVWLAIQGSENRTSRTHSEFLSRFSELVSKRSCLPEPWSASYCGRSDEVFGLAYDPLKKIVPKNWPQPNDAPEFAAKALQTTHMNRALERLKSPNTKSNKSKTEVSISLPRTTLMDFVYRLRIRTNYNDVDPFLIHVRERQHIDGIAEPLECFYSATMAIAEGLIAKSVGAERYSEIVSDYVKWVGGDIASTVIQRRDLILEAT